MLHPSGPGEIRGVQGQMLMCITYVLCTCESYCAVPRSTFHTTLHYTSYLIPHYMTWLPQDTLCQKECLVNVQPQPPPNTPLQPLQPIPAQKVYTTPQYATSPDYPTAPHHTPLHFITPPPPPLFPPLPPPHQAQPIVTHTTPTLPAPVTPDITHISTSPHVDTANHMAWHAGAG